MFVNRSNTRFIYQKVHFLYDLDRLSLPIERNYNLVIYDIKERTNKDYYKRKKLTRQEMWILNERKNDAYNEYISVDKKSVELYEKNDGKAFDKCYNVTDQYAIRRIRYRDTDIQFHDFAGTQYYNTDNDLFINLDVLILMVDDSKISYRNGKKAAVKILAKYSPKRVMLVQNKIDNDKLLSRAYKISVKEFKN